MDRTTRFRRGVVAVVAAGLAGAGLAGCGATGPHNKQNALHPQGPYAHKILDLTAPFFWIAVAIGAFVVSGTLFVALRFRERAGDPVGPKQTHGNTPLEITWTVIPGVILAVMGIATVATIFDLAQKPSGPGVVHVDVIAKQWFWEYEYPDEGFVTANEMHVPVGHPVSLDLTSPADGGVIHSFWIPELNGKKDVVPGRHQFLKLLATHPGTYLGQCAEYCGLSHANMRLRVVAQAPADYQRWVADQRTALSASQSAAIAPILDKWGCNSCHSFVNGLRETKVRIGPNLTHLADRDGFAGDMYRMTFDNLWKWVYDAPARKPMGNLRNASITHMPSFKDAGMSTDEAKSIACTLLTDTATEKPPPPPSECPSP